MNYISKLIRQYLDRRHPPEIEAKIQQWLVDDEHTEEKDSTLHGYWDEITASRTTKTHEALAKVKQCLGMDEPHRKIIPMRRKLLRTAAVLIPLLIASAGYWYASRPVPMVEVVVNNGQRQQITLPDGSEVWISAGSTLAYPEKFSRVRTIELSGEAYFSVVKNRTRPFIVETEHLSVNVLGTEFNVTAYPGDDKTTTALVSGKIKVAVQNGESVILSPSQQLSLFHDTYEYVVGRITTGDILARRDGHLVFGNAALAEILKTIERHYGVVLDTRNIKFSDDRYSVRFTNGETVEQAMKVLEKLSGNSISVKNK